MLYKEVIIICCGIRTKDINMFLGLNVYTLARLQNCEKRLLASSCLSVCPSIRMEQRGFHWTDVHEI